LPSAFGARLHARTEGNPLFVVDLLRYLRARGVIAPGATGAWALAEGATEAENELPPSIRSLIERKIAQLDPLGARLLATASVQGHVFDSLVIARALGLDPVDVEERPSAAQSAASASRKKISPSVSPMLGMAGVSSSLMSPPGVANGPSYGGRTPRSILGAWATPGAACSA
jgi:hypothetical protein